MQLLRRVTVRNFKSLAATSVDLGRLTVLVGANGSGKSNFVDALRFVSDCLTTSISLALQNRGGIDAVRRRSRGHPTNFGMRLVIQLDKGEFTDYSLEIAAREHGGFEVKREKCSILGKQYEYSIENGTFTKGLEGIRPRIEPDRLALSVVSAVPEFRPVYDFLTSMRFYALSPDRIRQLQDPDQGEVLSRDGSNAAAVLREIKSGDQETYRRVCELLAKVVPGTSQADYFSRGQKSTLIFKQDVGDKDPWSFEALSMSDGTLRVLGILLAVYQVSRPPFIVIEEPESTIHPAALDVLMDILRDGSSRSQVLITTHSPDFLDNRKIEDAELRIVTAKRGQTSISPLSDTTRDIIHDHLYSPGELLRMDQLLPTEKEVQVDLFGRLPRDAYA